MVAEFWCFSGGGLWFVVGFGFLVSMVVVGSSLVISGWLVQFLVFQWWW